jgi:zeta-carotene desaturase
MTASTVRPGGAVDVLKRGLLPAPLHLAGSLLRFGALDAADKWSVIRGLGKLKRDAGRPDLEAITMSDWLRSAGATETALRRFWQPILVSALNEDLDRTAAQWGFQVFLAGMLESPVSYEMGIPAVPLAELYSSAGSLGKNVHVHLRSAVERIDPAGSVADFYVCAVPFQRVADLVPGLGLQLDKFEHSPITGIHLWYDRPITSLPHAVLLDRRCSGLRKSETYVQAVEPCVRSTLPRAEIANLQRAVRVLSGLTRGSWFARTSSRRCGRPSHRAPACCRSARTGDKYPNLRRRLTNTLGLQQWKGRASDTAQPKTSAGRRATMSFLC